MSFDSRKFLAVYSGALTLAFSIAVFCGFARAKNTDFEQITVRRINVVEPDGTLRLVVSNKADAPGAFVKGKEYPHQRGGDGGPAGFIFLNDEGSEQGGLSWIGFRDKTGKPQSDIHLGFDRYEQDQTFTVNGEQNGDEKSTRLNIVDQPDWPITDILEAEGRIGKLPKEAQKAELDKFFKTHKQGHLRIVIARNTDKSAEIQLKDARGRSRLVLRVADDGAPSIEMLGADGKPTYRLPPADPPILPK